jgi:UMF1 family MFS transporter
MRLVGPLVGLFFFFAALPTFALLKERGVPRPLPEGQTWLTVGFAQLADTARSLGKFQDLARFFGSFVFAMAGLSIVVSFAFIYGDQVIHWQPSTAVLTFVVVQITAAAGALGFGFVQDRIGDVRAYAVTLCIWIGTVLLIAGTAPICAALAGVGVNLSAEYLFLGVGGCAGICLGATQSAARTIVALFAPEERVNEFFGLWGLVGKCAAIFGLMSLGALQATLGLQTAILLCAVFFGIALAVVMTVDPIRGRRVARGEA